MFEIFKLLWDVVVLRDQSRKGNLNWRIWPVAFGAVLVLYGVGFSAALLDEKYPKYQPLFLVVLVLDALGFLVFLVWAYRWQKRMAAARKSAAAIDQSGFVDIPGQGNICHLDSERNEGEGSCV